MDNILTEEQQRAKETFIQERGIWKWSDMWESILRMDCNIVSAFARFSSCPHKADVLEPKVRELICVAIDASIIHLHEPGMRNHIRRALELGATKEELLETLEICSCIGTHTFVTALPILLEKCGEVHKERKKEEPAKSGRMMEKPETWDEVFEQGVKLDSKYFDAFFDFINAPRKHANLPEKTRELIYLAVDASPTTVYIPGIKEHVKNALSLGATPLEILNVLEIVAGLGIHSITVGVPLCKMILEETSEEN